MTEVFKRSRLFHFLDWLFSFGLLILIGAMVLLAFCEQAYGQKPQIFVDNVNGAANVSGSPEAFGPFSALATCHTNGAASTTIQWAANPLAGVPVDGSAILFLNTAAGRQYSQITARAAGTVTVQDSFNITLVGAVDCGVGGRLLNVSTQLALDMQGGQNEGWQVFIVNSGVNYTWTASRVAGSTLGCGFFGVPDGSGARPTVDCDFQPGICLNNDTCEVVGIQLRNTNVVKTGTVGLNLDTGASVRNTIIGGDTTATGFAIAITIPGTSSAIGNSIVGSLIQNNVTGITSTAQAFSLNIMATVFRNNTTGILYDGNTQNAMMVYGSLFWENDVGIQLGNNDYSYYNAIFLNTFHNNSTTAIDITDPGGLFNLLLASNLFTNNSIGVRYTGAARNIEREASMVDYNCYGLGGTANGSNISGFVVGPNDIDINPLYVDAATGDFTPRVTNFTIQAWPPGLNNVYPGTLTESLIGCGAIQPGGGGSGFSDVGI